MLRQMLKALDAPALRVQRVVLLWHVARPMDAGDATYCYLHHHKQPNNTSATEAAKTHDG